MRARVTASYRTEMIHVGHGEGESLDALIEDALERANASNRWHESDYCSETTIDAIGAPEDDNPLGSGGRWPVPREAMDRTGEAPAHVRLRRGADPASVEIEGGTVIVTRETAYGTLTEIRSAKEGRGTQATVTLRREGAPEVVVHRGALFVEHKGFEGVGAAPVRMGGGLDSMPSMAALVQLERTHDGHQHVRVRQGTPQIEVVDAR